MPLTIVYGLWSKKEIEKFVYRVVRVKPNQTTGNEYTEVDYDEVFDDKEGKKEKKDGEDAQSNSTDSFL